MIEASWDWEKYLKSLSQVDGFAELPAHMRSNDPIGDAGKLEYGDRHNKELPKPLPRVVGLDSVGHILLKNIQVPYRDKTPLDVDVLTSASVISRLHEMLNFAKSRMDILEKRVRELEAQVPDGGKDAGNLSTASLISRLYSIIKITDSRIIEMEEEREMLSDPYQKIVNAMAYLRYESVPWSSNHGTLDAINILEYAKNEFTQSSRVVAYNKYTH